MSNIIARNKSVGLGVRLPLSTKEEDEEESNDSYTHWGEELDNHTSAWHLSFTHCFVKCIINTVS